MMKKVVSTYAIETPCAVTDMKYCPGVPIFAPNGLRTHICQVPIRQANRNAPNATQKCARQSRSTLRTGNPPVGTRLETILGQNLHRCPHLAVPLPAIFMTRHQEVAGAGEFGMHLCHEAGDYHGVNVGAGDQQSMDHIWRSKTERDPSVGWDGNALRH